MFFKSALKTVETENYSSETATGDTNGQLSTIPFYSRRIDEFVSYVHKLVHIGSIIINITPDMKDKLPKNFKISYQIFGSWADKQEGSIDVSVNVE